MLFPPCQLYRLATNSPIWRYTATYSVFLRGISPVVVAVEARLPQHMKTSFFSVDFSAERGNRPEHGEVSRKHYLPHIIYGQFFACAEQGFFLREHIVVFQKTPESCFVCHFFNYLIC